MFACTMSAVCCSAGCYSTASDNDGFNSDSGDGGKNGDAEGGGSGPDVDGDTDSDSDSDSDNDADSDSDTDSDSDIDPEDFDAGSDPPCIDSECLAYCISDGYSDGECINDSCVCSGLNDGGVDGSAPSCFDDLCEYDSECCPEHICGRLYGGFEIQSSCHTRCTHDEDVCSPVEICGGIVGPQKICMIRGEIELSQFRSAYNLNTGEAHEDSNSIEVNLAGIQYTFYASAIRHTKVWDEDFFQIIFAGYDQDDGYVLQLRLELPGEYYAPGTYNLWDVADHARGMLFEIMDPGSTEPQNVWIRGAVVGGTLIFTKTPSNNGGIAEGYIKLVLGRYDAEYFMY